jgi:signal transduction histidine kinase
MERKRIASGLHDGLGQNLLIMKNRSLLGLNSNDLDVAKKELEEISSTASSAIDEVRQISYNLHPYQLSRLGLTKAIESMINNTSSSSEIKFSKSIENIDDLVSKQSEINIYRIVQECINNNIKHSKADNVKIKIKSDEKKIDILVIDDGIGFDAEVAQAHGFGMQNLLKRTDLLKGKLNIDSSSGRGTKINIVIPK